MGHTVQLVIHFLNVRGDSISLLNKTDKKDRGILNVFARFKNELTFRQCLDFHVKHCVEGDLLCQIVTGNETWFSHVIPE